jgi:hypothetical protein
MPGMSSLSVPSRSAPGKRGTHARLATRAEPEVPRSSLGIGIALQVAPDTAMRLATAAFAFESLEIATYQLIARLAERAGDAETVAVAQRILEQEEAAAELLAGTFDRTVELMLEEPGRSPLPAVTPLGKPSEREPQPTRHPGPQAHKDVPPDEPVSQPPDITSPADEEREDDLASPEPVIRRARWSPPLVRFPRRSIQRTFTLRRRTSAELALTAP